MLSGFLITSLLLGRMRDGRLDVFDFWTRRLRRLLPALLVLVGVVVAWGAFVAPAVIRDGLRGDIAATLFYVANWHFIATSTYFASNGVPSPLEHMWSLAVEEQFYLVWPLLLVAIALLVREPGRRVAAVGVIAAVGLAASAVRLGLLWGSSGQDRAYLGTDSRIFEPLAGALLAALMTSAVVRRFVTRAHWGLLAAGGAALVWGLAVLGGPGGATRAYADGGAVVVALGTAAVIAAIATRDSRVTSGAGAACRRLPRAAFVCDVSLALAAPGLDGAVRVVGPERAGHAGSGRRSSRRSRSRSRRSPTTWSRSRSATAASRASSLPAGCSSRSRWHWVRCSSITSSVVVPRAGAALGRVTRTIVLVGDSVPQRLAPDLARAAARYGYVVVSATRGSCPATGVAVVGVTGQALGRRRRVRHRRAGAAGRRDRQVPPGARDLVEPLRARRPRRRARTARPVRLARLLEAAGARVRDPHGTR